VPEDYFSWFLITFLAAVSQEFAFAEEMTGTRARRSDVEESTWLCRELGRSFSAAELSVTLERLHRATRQIAGLFETYDLLLTPALARLPVRHQSDLDFPVMLSQSGVDRLQLPVLGELVAFLGLHGFSFR
jgi:amidase